MAYGKVLTDVIQSSTAGTAPQFNDGNGTQIGTLCRAWVNFNGTTSPGTIRASFNVTSVTRTGTGTFVINLTNAFSDVNYAISANITADPTSSCNNQENANVTRTTSSFGIATLVAGTLANPSIVSIAVFR